MRQLCAPFLIVLVVLAAGCGSSERAAGQSDITMLITVDERVGTGNEAMFGREVVVHYTGWLYDALARDNEGREFDSSRDRNDPLSFRLGAGEVIKGWDDGIVGMKVGGRRLLTIPPDLAYGAEGMGELIPPNATLIFDVELLDVK
jgi:FKBP-type peptidyl-prolyl cis-trans isomerase FkpA